MILKLDMTPEQAAQRFRWLEPSDIESYRDATFNSPDFRLSLLDCWRGLAQAKTLGWVRYAPSGFLWGAIDIDEYRHYDSVAQGNLTEVVPGKLVAFQGPEDLPGGAEYRDDARGARAFSPGFYADILLEMGVRAVVRLNEARYDAAALTARGLAHVDLAFPDCTCPPAAVAARFLAVAEAAPGAVAVHCKAGLGRTGTLIALYMMKHHGFGARAAMGWLRIVRPGSVIGEQQRYLCAVEAARGGRASFGRAVSASGALGATMAGATKAGAVTATKDAAPQRGSLADGRGAPSALLAADEAAARPDAPSADRVGLGCWWAGAAPPSDEWLEQCFAVGGACSHPAAAAAGPGGVDGESGGAGGTQDEADAAEGRGELAARAAADVAGGMARRAAAAARVGGRQSLGAACCQ